MCVLKTSHPFLITECLESAPAFLYTGRTAPYPAIAVHGFPIQQCLGSRTLQLQGTVQCCWDGSCREIKKDISENWWLPCFCLGHFLHLVLLHCSVADISAAHFEKQSETSVRGEQSRKPDVRRGGVIFATVLILLSFILVREVKNLWATAPRLTPLWMASP